MKFGDRLRFRIGKNVKVWVCSQKWRFRTPLLIIAPTNSAETTDEIQLTLASF